jgi:hypothetical protein
MTVGIGRATFGPSVGVPAGLILATTIGYTVYSRVVSTDLVFTGFLSLVYSHSGGVSRPWLGMERTVVCQHRPGDHDEG